MSAGEREAEKEGKLWEEQKWVEILFQTPANLDRYLSRLSNESRADK